MAPIAMKALLGGLGLAGLVALASKSKAAPKTGEVLPSDVVSRMVAVLASKDPAAMRALASELRARGFIVEAQQLEAAAAALDGKSTTPGAGAGPVQDSKQLLAAAVVRSLVAGKLDVAKLRAFQVQEGLTPDGLYGPKSATALIKYGFVPPTPTSWPAGAEGVKAKAAYAALLRVQADKDNVRHEEWLLAAAAVDPAKTAAAPAPAKPASTSSSSSSSSSPSSSKKVPTLRVGSRGPDVVFLQRLLNMNGAAVVQDGNFTNALAATVKSFQQGHRLTADGVVGPKTWTALGAFKQSSTPPAGSNWAADYRLP